MDKATTGTEFDLPIENFIAAAAVVAEHGVPAYRDGATLSRALHELELAVCRQRQVWDDGQVSTRALAPAGLAAVAVAAILVIPLLALILLSLPTWITWSFLSTERRTTVLEFVDRSS